MNDRLENYDCLFIAPHADDVMLACPARVYDETQRGRRALVLALFAKGTDSSAAEAARKLGADFIAAGLTSAQERHVDAGRARGEPPLAEETVRREAARLLADAGPRTRAVHVYAPLGLGPSTDHRLAYEAAVRAFASERGRNLFLYEERPEAFVPGAVRVRLALLGAQLPPAARRSVPRVSLLRHMWSVNDARKLRGEAVTFGDRLAALAGARRRFCEARPWNPHRALGPRVQPVVHVADEEAATRARAVSEMLIGRRRGGSSVHRFNARAAGVARRLGGVYHAERFWLFLPSADGLPETEHPLDLPRG